ncbi:MAG TPA: type II toxin-antitoxin system RelE/ParE family toxin [Vineibacter sp.]|nr:type II toxin-antitoxin system RelE/ParE family toxin [Vineibacter sp.]
MKVVITASAEADLNEIGDFIRKDNPLRAVSFVDELLNRCEELGSMAAAFPLVPRYEHVGIRRRPYRGYLIFYRISGELVEIIHVLNGVRDYERLLFPGE